METQSRIVTDEDSVTDERQSQAVGDLCGVGGTGTAESSGSSRSNRTRAITGRSHDGLRKLTGLIVIDGLVWRDVTDLYYNEFTGRLIG